MAPRPKPPADLPKHAGRLLCAAALGLLLAGCDRCGDWPWSPSQGSMVCRPDTPKPPQ